MTTISVVVPAFNRARTLSRCLSSVVSQARDGLEVVVVDDGSEDDTEEIVRSFPSVRYIRHTRNLGVGPSRQSGVSVARGDWIILLDSDDELVAGAVDVCLGHIETCAADVGALAYRCTLDSGAVSPSCGTDVGVVDYAGYLKFLEATVRGRRDVLRCVRRSTFTRVTFAADRSLEDVYHLDFAKTYKTSFQPDALRLYHQDAEDRLVALVSRSPQEQSSDFLMARLASYIDVIVRHGPVMRYLAPSVYEQYVLRLAGMVAATRDASGKRLLRRLILSRGLRAGVAVRAICIVAAPPTILDWIRRLRHHP
jgi:glycosyltransferase involved in cell wall biosynthesis